MIKTVFIALRELLNLSESASVSFSIAANGDYFVNNTSTLTAATVSAKIAEIEAEEAAVLNSTSYKLEKLRAVRNQLLSESDWTQLPDAPVNKEAWALYRQSLRDLPQGVAASVDPDVVVFPTKPTA